MRWQKALCESSNPRMRWQKALQKIVVLFLLIIPVRAVQNYKLQSTKPSKNITMNTGIQTQNNFELLMQKHDRAYSVFQ